MPVELTQLTDADAPELAALFASIGMSPRADASAATGFIRHLNSDQAIGRKLVVAGVLVGGGQLTRQKHPHLVELGMWVGRDHQRRGYGATIARLLAELALGPLGFHRVFAKTSSANLGSQRCLERAGMVREGVLRDAGCKEGAYLDELYYGRLATDQPPA